jgi:hypothetical protein
MRERIDTFQVGPAAASEIKDLIRAKVVEVLAEARKTANGRTITVRATLTIEGAEYTAHIFIEHREDPETATDLVKERTVITETWKVGVYSSPELNP